MYSLVFIISIINKINHYLVIYIIRKDNLIQFFLKIIFDIEYVYNYYHRKDIILQTRY